MEFAGHVAGGACGDPQVGLRAGAVGDHAAIDARQNLLDVFVVQAQDRRAIERNRFDELDERPADLFEIRVVIQMLAVDVGDDRQNRRELQERSVALVAFDHQVIACAHARVRAAQHCRAPAHHHGGIETRVDQNGRHHRGGGGFAVAAGDGDAEFQAHQLGQQLAARDHGKPEAARFDDFRIVGPHRGADDHRLRAGDIRRRVAFVNHRSARRQTFGDGRELQVGSADRIAQFEQHFGQSAHADSADADEVDRLRLKKHFNNVLFRLSERVSIALAMRSCH